MIIEHKTNFILITDIIDNQFIKEKFIGYSEKESIRIFKRLTSKGKESNV